MVKKLSLLLFSSLALAACSNTQDATVETETIAIDESVESSSELTQAEWMEQYGPETATYADETLTTEYGTFVFKESDYIKYEDQSALIIIRFDYTNTTDENQNIESLIWDYFDGKQIFEKTTESTGYPGIDEEEPHYDEYNNTKVEINPGATVPGAYGISIDDSSVPLTLYLNDENGDVIGTKEYLLD